MLKVVCVDDEKLMLQHIISMCGEIETISDVQGFSQGKDALTWLENHACDLALLDIHLPDQDGIMLAKRIREIQPDADIVFVTGYSQYAVDAWGIHARGYLLKPVTAERLREETEYVLSLRQQGKPPRKTAHIEVRAFGNFDVLVDGRPVHFQRAKAKELLAYLVEKQGQGISREEAYRVMWEDDHYDRPAQKQFDVILRSLRATLAEYGIGDILNMQRGAIRIEPRLFECDMYRFLLGDVSAVSEYRGEYMTAYSWASLQEAYLERRIENLSQPF